MVKWVKVSISWLKVQIRYMKSWKLCLYLWSGNWFNTSSILVKKFNYLLLSTLYTWFDLVLIFLVYFLKNITRSRATIININLIPLYYNCRKRKNFWKSWRESTLFVSKNKQFNNKSIIFGGDFNVTFDRKYPALKKE